MKLNVLLEILVSNYLLYGTTQNYLANNVKNFYAALLIKLLFIVKNVILYLYELYGKAVIQQQRQLIRVGSFKELSSSKEMEEKIIDLSQKGENDKSIAQQLTAQGYRSPMKPYVIPSTVQTIRLKNRVLQKESQSHQLHKEGFLSVTQVAQKIAVDRHWIYDRIHNGRIKICKNIETNAYLLGVFTELCHLENYLPKLSLSGK